MSAATLARMVPKASRRHERRVAVLRSGERPRGRSVGGDGAAAEAGGGAARREEKHWRQKEGNEWVGDAW